MDGKDVMKAKVYKGGWEHWKGDWKNKERKTVRGGKEEENEQFDLFCKPGLLGSICVELNTP